MSLAAVCEHMGRIHPWAEGLKLAADGYECEFYKKNENISKNNFSWYNLIEI